MATKREKSQIKFILISLLLAMIGIPALLIGLTYSTRLLTSPSNMGVIAGLGLSAFMIISVVVTLIVFFTRLNKYFIAADSCIDDANSTIDYSTYSSTISFLPDMETLDKDRSDRNVRKERNTH